MGIPAHPCLQRRNLKIHNLPTIFGLSCHLCHCLCRTECFLVIQTFPWSRCKLAEIALAGVVSRETSSSTLLRNRARRRDRCRGRGTLKLSARLSSFTLQIQTDRKTTYIHMYIIIWIAVVKTHIKVNMVIMVVMVMVEVRVVMVVTIMVTQHIPTMTDSHHGGFLSAMIMVGICQVTKSHHS